MDLRTQIRRAKVRALTRRRWLARRRHVVRVFGSDDTASWSNPFEITVRSAVTGPRGSVWPCETVVNVGTPPGSGRLQVWCDGYDSDGRAKVSLTSDLWMLPP